MRNRCKRPSMREVRAKWLGFRPTCPPSRTGLARQSLRLLTKHAHVHYDHAWFLQSGPFLHMASHRIEPLKLEQSTLSRPVVPGACLWPQFRSRVRSTSEATKPNAGQYGPSVTRSKTSQALLPFPLYRYQFPNP